MSGTENGLVSFPPSTATRCLGRNGTIIAVGIYVDGFDHKIILTPQNSRRQMARCTIEIPNDSRVIIGFILELLKNSPGTREALQQELARTNSHSSPTAKEIQSR